MCPIPWPNSLGLFYAQFTEYLGFVPNSDKMESDGPGAVGLSGVKPKNSFRSIRSYKVMNAPLLFETKQRKTIAIAGSSAKRTAESEIDDSFEDIAIAVQDACEIAMLALVKHAVQMTNSRNVCLAGGVALNSKANGKIQAPGMAD